MLLCDTVGRVSEIRNDLARANSSKYLFEDFEFLGFVLHDLLEVFEGSRFVELGAEVVVHQLQHLCHRLVEDVVAVERKRGRGGGKGRGRGERETDRYRGITKRGGRAWGG